MTHDLNESLIFVKVVERGSFTAAATALGVPKTTVSRKVAELEQRLGTRLLMRTTRKLGLTEAGQVYFEHCAQIARDLDEAEAAVSQLNGAPRGWLRFTAPYSVGINLLAQVQHEFMAQYPEVRLEMVLDNDIVDIVGNELDLALRVGPLPDSTLAARRLVRFTSRVYASPAYLARHGEPLAPEELEHHRSVAGTRDRRSGGRFAWRLGRDGEAHEDFAVHPVFVANDPFMLRTAVLQGLGIGRLPDAMARPFEQHGLLRRVLASWAAEPADLNAVFPHGRALSPKVRAFVDFLATRLADIDALLAVPKCMLEADDTPAAAAAPVERLLADLEQREAETPA